MTLTFWWNTSDTSLCFIWLTWCWIIAWDPDYSLCWIFASVIRNLSGWCCDLVSSFNYFAIVLTDESYECCPGWWYCDLVSSFNYFAIVLTDESYEFWPGDAMTFSPVLGLFCCYFDFHKHSFLYRERSNLLLQQTSTAGLSMSWFKYRIALDYLSYWILRNADETKNNLENIEVRRKLSCNCLFDICLIINDSCLDSKWIYYLKKRTIWFGVVIPEFKSRTLMQTYSKC